MRTQILLALIALPLLGAALPLYADDYDDAIAVFRAADASDLFDSAHGYAVFPTIGKGGLGIGGAFGKGRVYVGGKHVADTSMTQATFGLQWGGQAYS